MKLFLRILLSLTLFLLGGFGYINANSPQPAAGYAPVKNSPPPAHICSLRSQDLTTFSIRSSVGEDKGGTRLKATEAEEDEDEKQSSSRKQSATRNYFSSFLSKPATCFSYLVRPLPLCRHFSYLSSFKYIFIRSIRV